MQIKDLLTPERRLTDAQRVFCKRPTASSIKIFNQELKKESFGLTYLFYFLPLLLPSLFIIHYSLFINFPSSHKSHIHKVYVERMDQHW